MKTSWILWILATVLIMILLPVFAVNRIPSDAGMIFSILSLLIINPLWALFTGFTAGGHPSGMWFMPLAMDILFTVGLSFLMTVDSQILFYLVIYTGLAYITMIIRALHLRKIRKQG